MRANTMIMLLIAMISGAIAVYAANIWLTGQLRSNSGSNAMPSAGTTTIVVAAAELPFGSTLQAANLKEIPWPKSALPSGAFARISDLTGGGKRVALASLGLNETVLAWKISGPDTRASLSAILSEGFRAVSVRVNDVAGVGGFVLPGDRVDVLYTRSGGGRGEAASTGVLIQGALVLGLDLKTDRKSGGAALAKVATLEVAMFEAQKIALAQATGTLSLALRAAGSLERAGTQQVVEQELVASPGDFQTAFAADAAARAKLDARLGVLEGSLLDVAHKVDQTNSTTVAALTGKLAALEDKVQQTARSTGQGETALRRKLAELETAIGAARNLKGEGESALKTKLASFEAKLRALASLSDQPIIVTPAADVAETPATVSVAVVRAMKRDAYVVPVEAE